jgi:geranylgeranyl diphosphate synthase type II
MIVKEPNNLYEPISYILHLGGKRLRPVLTLLSCEVFGGNKADALDAALSIEMFHNFSLVHDDIMDGALLRRGKKTVHEYWNINTGILSGDAMLVLSGKLLESYDDFQFKKLITVLNKTALDVCVGQQYDIDFETRNSVNIEEYLNMISLKTAVLLGSALKFGAIVAKAKDGDIELIYNYGINLGIAFQLQDDYLDVYGTEDFGKQIGGDILENKKTFLYVKALELFNESDKNDLLLYYNKNYNHQDKIEIVKDLFNKYNIQKNLKDQMELYTDKALNQLDNLSITEDKKRFLRLLADSLMCRKV